MKSTILIYMNKDLKNGLLVAGSAILLYLLYKQVTKKSDISSGCPSGLKPCNSNPSKCYDPNVNYIMDPCKAVGGSPIEVDLPIESPVDRPVDKPVESIFVNAPLNI